MPVQEKPKIKVVMIRQTLGEDLSILGVGKTYTVSHKFGSWLIWKGKAKAATAADLEKATPRGPITDKDLPGVTSRR